MKHTPTYNNLLKIKQEMDINAKKMTKQALVPLYASQAADFVDKFFAFSDTYETHNEPEHSHINKLQPKYGKLRTII